MAPQQVLHNQILTRFADHHLRQPDLVLYKISCFDCDAGRGGNGAALAPITPGIMKMKLELEASNAIAGELRTFTKVLTLPTFELTKVLTLPKC